MVRTHKFLLCEASIDDPALTAFYGLAKLPMLAFFFLVFFYLLADVRTDAMITTLVNRQPVKCVISRYPAVHLMAIPSV